MSKNHAYILTISLLVIPYTSLAASGPLQWLTSLIDGKPAPAYTPTWNPYRYDLKEGQGNIQNLQKGVNNGTITHPGIVRDMRLREANPTITNPQTDSIQARIEHSKVRAEAIKKMNAQAAAARQASIQTEAAIGFAKNKARFSKAAATLTAAYAAYDITRGGYLTYQEIDLRIRNLEKQAHDPEIIQAMIEANNAGDPSVMRARNKILLEIVNLKEEKATMDKADLDFLNSMTEEQRERYLQRAVDNAAGVI